jgi:hypothetical protein
MVQHGLQLFNQHLRLNILLLLVVEVAVQILAVEEVLAVTEHHHRLL